MCHHCVIENVKANMLSRRSLFKGSFAAAAAATVAVAPKPARAQAAAGEFADLTHELWDTFPTYFGGQQLFFDKQYDFEKDTFNLYELRIGDKYYDPTATPLPAGTDLEGARLTDFRKQISHVENIENYIGARIATAFAPPDDGRVHTAIH